jgi:hypothetical protein
MNNGNSIRAIETHYKGYRFRSRLEARWAVFFDRLGVKYEYEAQGFDLPSGKYLPDFRLVEKDTYLEIKPLINTDEKPRHSVYLAGKMTDWRQDLNLNGLWWRGPRQPSGHTGQHADTIIRSRNHHESRTPEEILDDCLSGIGLACVVFAWVDAADAYGTLVEIGYARGIGVPLYVAFKRGLQLSESKTSDWNNHGCKMDDLWFASMIANKWGYFDTPQQAFDCWFPLQDDEKKCAELSAGGKEVWLCRGDPFECREITVCFCGQVKGRWFQNDHRVWNADEGQFRQAAQAARSARFEFGETPR